MSAAATLEESKRLLDAGEFERASQAAGRALDAMSASGAAELLAEVVRTLVAAQAPPSELDAARVTLDEMLERFRNEGNITSEARVLLALAELRCAKLEAASALEAIEEYRSLGGQAADGDQAKAKVLNLQVNLHLMREAPAEAMDAAKEMLETAQQRGDAEGEAAAWYAMAGAHFLDAARASAAADSLEAARRARDAYRQLGRARGEAHALVAMARAALSMRNAAEGLRLAQDALDAWRRIGQTRGAVTALELLIQGHAMQGNPMAGLRAANEELAFVRQSGNKRGQLDFLDMMTHTHAVLREPASAIHYARQALDLYWALGDKAGQGWTLHTIAQMQRMQGQMVEATEAGQQALAAFQEVGNQRGEEVTSRALGEILAARGMPEQAPGRQDAMRCLRVFVKAVRQQSAEEFKAAEKDFKRCRHLLPDKDVVNALQPVLQEEGAMDFMEEHGWDLGRKTATTHGAGTLIKAYDHKVFYLQQNLNGMNFGPQFRVVHPFSKRDLEPKPPGEWPQHISMSCSQIEDAEGWQQEMSMRPGILDSGIQCQGSAAWP